MTKRADEILTEAAATFKERNAEYGDNWKMVGKVMHGLFPCGVILSTSDDWNRMHILLLKVVKLTRYTNNWKHGHLDSIRDDTVYGALLEMIDTEIGEKKKAEDAIAEVDASEAAAFKYCTTCDRMSVCSRTQTCQQGIRMPGLRKTSA